MKLSHSSVSRYLKCPESYNLHYIKKIRPKVTSAALLFGSALDNAVNCLLTKEGDAYAEFDKWWNKGFINKKLVELAHNTDIVYAAKDFDSKLLNASQIDQLRLHLSGANLPFRDPVTAYKALNAKRKDSNDLTTDEQVYLNYVNWMCLYTKGNILIKEYELSIIPKIKSVVAVQKKITFSNDDPEPDTIDGFIDLIAVWEDGKTYVLDNKTSGIRYDLDSVKLSPQLSLYAKHEGLEHAGFIVMQKNILNVSKRICSCCGTIEENNRVKSCSAAVNGSRCGGALDENIELKGEINVILDRVNDKMVNMVMSNFTTISSLIKNNVFYKNPDTCGDYYGGLCPYYNLCHNDSMNGLTEDQKEEDTND